MKKVLKNIITLAIFLSIGVFFIWYFVKDLTPQETSEIIDSFRNANYAFVGMSLITGLLSVYFRAARWKMLIKPLGYSPSIWNLNFSVLIAYLSNLALPRLGEVTRCGVLAKYEKIPFQKGFGTVITERIVDVITMAIIMGITITVEFNQVSDFFSNRVIAPMIKKFDIEISDFIIFGGIAIFVCIALLIIFRKRLLNLSIAQKIKEIIRGFGEGVRSISQLKQPVMFVVYTVLIWVMYFSMTYIVFFALPETSQLSLGAGLAALSFGGIAMVISQGGIGAYPFFIMETLLLYGISSTAGYAMGWIIWSSQTLMIILGGFVSLILLPLVNKNKKN